MLPDRTGGAGTNRPWTWSRLLPKPNAAGRSPPKGINKILNINSFKIPQI